MGKRKRADWMGTQPRKCDTCSNQLSKKDTFVDGKTQMGPWAIMCLECHGHLGVGLGTGRGQQYEP